ncbi:MAG: transcription repressor NadR [Defluviitaleaceae bacterium]|nr:transcription repressor NadR [Defluviitaleaceae bacterium]
MNANTRRKHILDAIEKADAPISASALAGKLDVSRQIIVGDVALLRAQGHEITATSRGYIVSQSRDENKFFGKVACQHTAEATQSELYIIVDLGGIIVNVIVEHELYGEITGCLNLKNRDDVDAFLARVKSSEAKLLAELTQGVHLHTIACRDKAHFEGIVQALKAQGFLFEN